jgi:hypothetical protein
MPIGAPGTPEFGVMGRGSAARRRAIAILKFLYRSTHGDGML